MSHCEVGQVTGKDNRVLLPLGAHLFVRGQPSEALQALSVVVGQQKSLQVLVELIGVLVMQALVALQCLPL